MPEGVEISIEDGEATVVFRDRTKRGQGIQALLDAGGAENVSKVSRPETGYVVPDWVAMAAGLVDGHTPLDDGQAVVDPPKATVDGTGSGTLSTDTPALGDSDGGTATGTLTSPNADDGKPDMDWSRQALNEYATEHGVADAEKLPNKPAVLDAIRSAELAAQKPVTVEPTPDVTAPGETVMIAPVADGQLPAETPAPVATQP